MGTNASSETRALNALRHFVRALAGSSRNVVSSTGISGAQLFVLRALADRSTPVSVNELAELTLTHQSTVSGVVTRLVERSLVNRVPAEDDARRMEISITARGARLAAEAPATAQSQIVRGIATLTREQRAALADALEAWLIASGLDTDAAPMFHERD
ncbi:MAG: MarR family transcriptional regulator [Gemmatimonadaceae bacterium]